MKLKKFVLGAVFALALVGMMGCNKDKEKDEYASKITIGKYKGIEVEKMSTQPTKDDIESQIKSYLYTLKDEKIKKVKDGDNVNIDFEGKIDGEAFDGGSSEGYDLLIGSNSFIDDFEEQLIDKKVGKEYDIKVTFPKDYAASEELQGKDAVFTVKINYVSPRKLTDKIVKKDESNECKTVEEYETYVEEQLIEQLETTAESSIKSTILTKIVENARYNDKNIKEDIDRGIQAVIDSAAFIKGAAVSSFQANLEQYTGAKHVIPVGNGTDALQIALMALGLKPGDEVITPTFTFIATAEVVALLGLTPVVVDVDWDTMNISVEAVKKAITKKTKAIVPVHLFGQCADMEELMAIAKAHNLYIIEDACQAIGSVYRFADGTEKQAGTMGEIGCTSFFPSKNLGCYGDGGAIFTNDDELAAKMRAIANHGMVVRYYHDTVGVNSRLDSIQAAVLDVKLKHLDEYIAARQKAATYYDNAFANHPHILVPARSEKSSHVFHQYTLRLVDVDRDAMREALAEAGVPAMIYYPVPLHMQKAYQDARYQAGDFPVAERLAACVLSLPMHTELDEEQLKYIVEAIGERLKARG